MSEIIATLKRLERQQRRIVNYGANLDSHIIISAEAPATTSARLIWIDTSDWVPLLDEEGAFVLTESGGQILVPGANQNAGRIRIRNEADDAWLTPWRFGNASGFTEFEADGTLVMVGGATAFDDIRIAAVSTKLGGSFDPGFEVFKTNGAGSQGVFLYWFDKAREEELYFELQIPHTYKFESDIHPHVHWVPKTNGAAGAVVSWGLEYTWADIGETFGNTAIVYGNVHTPADNVLVAGRHYLTELTDISGAGHDFVSSMLSCRVFRNATGAAGSTDSYDDDAGLLEFDFHIEMDTLGSRTEFSK